MDPEKEDALQAAEVRKKLLEEAAEAQAHRTGGTEEEELRHHGPEPQWKPPKEVSMKPGGVTVRFVLFLLLLGGAYFLFRQGSLILFQPELVTVGPVVPGGRIAPGQPIRVGVQVGNTTRFAARAFVVAALPGGEEVAGTPVEVPGNDTVLVPVEVRLPVGDHVLSLVAFESYRGDRRMETYRGLNVWVGDREIELGEFSLPATLERSDTMVVEFSGTNSGVTTASVVPVLVFGSAQGEATEVDGPVAEIAPGETGNLQITIVAANLDPGRYTVQVLARTPQGERLAQGRLPSAVEVRN